MYYQTLKIRYPDLQNLTPEPESQAYGACTFELNGQKILYRTAKITRTKTGQFVTLWKRIGSGPIQPFDLSDPFDLYIIAVEKDNLSGHFTFPKAILAEHGILSKEGRGGKRAIRVYPPWDYPESKIAKKTQSWQLKNYNLF